MVEDSIRLCSEFEECPPLPFPLRLLDVYMGYEDHCKQINSFPLSKDYVAKVLVKVFPGATRRFQYLNNQKYASYVGIRRCEVSEKGLPEPADMTTEGCLSVPTIFKIDQKPVKVEFNVKDGMSIVAGGEKRLVDLSLIDMPSNIQITNQEKALFQIGKEIRLCRGFISKTRSPEERYWSNLLTKEEELRISSHSCQAVIPWLSSSDICAPCRTFQKRQVTVSKPRQPDIVPESQDEALLQAVLERLPRDENAEAGKLGKLLKSQLRNTNLSDPRARRWTPEIIQLCLTIYCRSPQAYNDLRESGVCVLPTPRLLQYYKNSVDQAPGVNEQQLNWMVKEAAAKNITEFGKRGGLILDEMSIQDDIQIVRQGDSWVVVGMVDNGQPSNNIQTIINEGQKTKMATHVLQFVFQGFTGFRQGEICTHVAALLFKAEACTRLGFNKVSCTSDPCTWNQNYTKKKTDTSSLAQFYFADEELNLVAAELDSFDGRKDPERCTLLVNQLRACQDRVLNEIQKIMDDAIPGQRANRDFRVKFPDDVLQESLAGQLWFGAECLAAGSSILNREVESASMRPLARALTKNLDSLRCILRDQSLRNVTEYTERIQEALVIFDKLFAEFELSYVSAMVPVKTMKEYDMLQEVTVLFSETVQRALVKDLLFQEMIDDYDPALMFTIPRLAIVCGLLIYPEGPLNPDMDPTSMSEMYRPFQTLLFKIRELLYTLSANELNLLEKSLCSSEEPEVSTPALAHSEQLLQIDQGFDEGADHVPLEGIGSTILVHSANSGSPVTPVNQDLSDFLPNITALSTPRGNFQFTDDESLSILNKSESQDSGLHSENVSTSDTITVDAVPLMTHDTAGAIGVVVPTVEDCDTSVESDTIGKDTLDSVEELTTSLDQLKWGNESNESACLKSCCRLESGGVSHMCRNILEEVVDDVVTLNNYGSSIDSKINSNGNEITRQFSWQYNVQFAIPQISVSDQEIGNRVDRDSFSSESTLSDLGSRDHFTDDVLDTLAQLSDARASETLSKSRSELDESTAVTPKCSSAVNETPRVTPMCSSAVNETSRVTPKCSSEAGTSAETICDSDTTSTSCDKHSPQNNPSDTLTGDSNMNTNGYSSKVASSSGAGTSTVSDPAASSSSVTLCEPASSSSVTELLDAGLQSVSSQTSYPNSHMRRKVSSKQRRQGSLERIHCKTGAQRTDSGDPPPEIPRIQRLRYTENVASGRHNNCDCDVEKDCNCTGSETSSYNSECNDEEEIALAIQAAELASRNEARSRFRSSSDLIHRLFVCIAGVADQLQTNYASDLRHILKCVFEMNSNNIDPDEEDVISKETETVQGQVTHSEGQGSSEDRLETDRSRASPPDRQSNGSGTEPPKWVPDEESTGCTSCKAPFTFVRRRHHCRNCGKIFCGRCSANSVPLPQYGHQRPVRVCNKCFMFQVTHFTVDD